MAINTITGNTVLQSGFFPPVRVASTGSALNPSTGGLLTVDGITLIAGDRVLCKDETSAVNNGIYAANTGPWVRTSDAATNQQFFSGMAVVVALGSTNAKSIFICTTSDDPVVVGTSLITFSAQLPIGSGNVVGPGSSTTGYVAGFASATGTLLEAISTTGTGQVVFSVSPSLTTPFLDHATASTYNNLAITQPAGTATLTISSSSTVAFTNSMSLSAASGAVLTINNLGMTLSGTSGKTFTLDNSLEFAGTDATKFTFPSANDLVMGITAVQTIINKTFDSAGAGNVMKIGGVQVFPGELPGTTTNDAATAGNIGEYHAAQVPTFATSSTVSITIGTPAVISWTSHPYQSSTTRADAAAVTFVTSGSLPTGISANTVYYVIPSTITTTSFEVATTVANAIAGTAVNTTGSQSGTQTALCGAVLTSSQAFDVAGLALGEGDWDVWTNFTFAGNAATTVSLLQGSLSFTSATQNNTAANFAQLFGLSQAIFNGITPTVNVGPVRVSLSSTQNVFSVAVASFSVSSAFAAAALQARRAR